MLRRKGSRVGGRDRGKLRLMGHLQAMYLVCEQNGRFGHDQRAIVQCAWLSRIVGQTKQATTTNRSESKHNNTSYYDVTVNNLLFRTIIGQGISWRRNKLYSYIYMYIII